MAKLTKASRSALPSKDFALPKTRQYPIPDRSHAEAALRELHNANPTGRKRIRAAIAKRYPDLTTHNS